MKLSFSLSSSSKSSKPTIPSSSSSSSSSDEQPPQKEFITEFDQSKPTSNDNPIIIIPPIPNQWNPQNQLLSNITNGLNICDKKQTCGSGLQTLSSIDRLMLMKLKNDLKTLPDDKGLGEFEDVSVEEFGVGYLKGYGWYEGRGIGKNVAEDVKVFKFTKRSGSEGLGFHGSRNVVKSEKCGKNGGKRVGFCDKE